MTIDPAAAPELDQTTEQIPHPPQMHPLSAANGKYRCKSPVGARAAGADAEPTLHRLNRHIPTRQHATHRIKAPASHWFCYQTYG